jgi:hypothetical protein
MTIFNEICLNIQLLSNNNDASTFTFSSFHLISINTPSSSLMDSITSPNVKTTKGEKIRAHSLICNTSRVEGGVGALGWGLRKLISKSIIHTELHKPNNKLVNA